MDKLIPELNNLTTESNICYNRFIFERLDEDSLKSNLQLKITSVPNSKNLISDTIIRFAYHLSEYDDYLECVVKNFL